MSKIEGPIIKVSQVFLYNQAEDTAKDLSSLVLPYNTYQHSLNSFRVTHVIKSKLLM